MSRLFHKSLVDKPHQALPAARNRLIATFGCSALPDFEPVGRAIQPFFQRLGYAYPLYYRPASGNPFYIPTNFNLKGPLHALAMAVPLCSPAEFEPLSRAAADQFVQACHHVANEIAGILQPSKLWFGRKSSSTGSLPKLIEPSFDKSVEQAVAEGAKMSEYLRRLPTFQRHLVLTVKGTNPGRDELVDFADFAGLVENVGDTAWRDPHVGVVMVWQAGTLSLYIPSVPATWKPELVLETLVDLKRRFTAEFGGVTSAQDDETCRRLVLGWRNVLAPIGLQPGDEESVELFPPITSP